MDRKAGVFEVALSLKGARVLVTGGTGFLGSHLVRRFLKEGCQVRATYYQNCPFIEDDRVEFVKADLTDKAQCHQVTEDLDYVFMCAAVTSGIEVITTTPLAHVTPNVVMNAYMLEAAYTQRVKKFCFISSNCVYPPAFDRAVTEEEMLAGDPYDIYFGAGWMKRYSEILCQTYAEKIQNSMPVLVVRPTNIYGPCDDFHPRTSHMMAALIRKVVERQRPIEVWGSGDEVKDLIYVSDFVDGTLAAFQIDDAYLALNLSYGCGYSVREVIEAIVRVDGFDDAEIFYDKSKPVAIPKRLVDNRLAKEKAGFEPTISLEEGIARTVRWFRENRNTWAKV